MMLINGVVKKCFTGNLRQTITATVLHHEGVRTSFTVTGLQIWTAADIVAVLALIGHHASPSEELAPLSAATR